MRLSMLGEMVRGRGPWISLSIRSGWSASGTAADACKCGVLAMPRRCSLQPLTEKKQEDNHLRPQRY
eukprot:1435241-Pyramimonas_sp.AAC.1